MSTKISIAYQSHGDTTYHLYKDGISENIRMSVETSGQRLEVELPLPFLAELSRKLPAQIQEMVEVCDASDSKLRQMARDQAATHLRLPLWNKLAMDEGHLEEALYEDLLATRKRLQDGLRKDTTAA